MNAGWNLPQIQNAGAGDPPVSLLLAHREISVATAWYQAIQVDARFRVAALANTQQDLRAKLASSPEAILLDATLFDGPSQLLEALTAITSAVYLILPGGVRQEQVEELKSAPSVKQIYAGDVNIADFTSRCYADALALRRTVPAVSQAAWAGGRTATAAPAGGLRIIAVWNRAGGAGRTTLAVSLAQALARRNVRTLLIGLGSPDVIPLSLGLMPEPNILAWFSNPADEGLRSGIQTAGDLHVLAGFPDILSEDQGARPSDAKGSLNELVTTAAYNGYSAILLDTPSHGVLAARAISAANTWLMVARPTVMDAWSSVESFRTVTQRAAGQHRIVPGNIFVVLNQRSSGMMTADQWHSASDSAARKLGLNVGFPPVMSVLPYAPEVALSQDGGRSALDASDEFARPVHRIADALFGGAALPQTSSSNDGVLRLGPLKIRTKK